MVDSGVVWSLLVVVAGVVRGSFSVFIGPRLTRGRAGGRDSGGSKTCG